MSNKYITEFLRLKCAPDLIAWKLFPNIKEITESMGCYNAVVTYLVDEVIKLSDHNINLISVGDGTTPRTAALFALRSAWQCFSIDPCANNKDYSQIKRLYISKKKIEDCALIEHSSPTVIVCVHSHATLSNVMEKIKAPIRHIVTIPCCVPHELMDIPYTGYRDKGILSPKNEVKIWKNV